MNVSILISVAGQIQGFDWPDLAHVHISIDKGGIIVLYHTKWEGMEGGCFLKVN